MPHPFQLLFHLLFWCIVYVLMYQWWFLQTGYIYIWIMMMNNAREKKKGLAEMTQLTIEQALQSITQYMTHPQCTYWDTTYSLLHHFSKIILNIPTIYRTDSVNNTSRPSLTWTYPSPISIPAYPHLTRIASTKKETTHKKHIHILRLYLIVYLAQIHNFRTRHTLWD